MGKFALKWDIMQVGCTIIPKNVFCPMGNVEGSDLSQPGYAFHSEASSEDPGHELEQLRHIRWRSETVQNLFASRELF